MQIVNMADTLKYYKKKGGYSMLQSNALDMLNNIRQRGYIISVTRTDRGYVEEYSFNGKSTTKFFFNKKNIIYKISYIGTHGRFTEKVKK